MRIQASGPDGFNPRSRVGSDNRRLNSHPALGPFQSTLPCRERPVDDTTTLVKPTGFNPRSRVGSD